MGKLRNILNAKVSGNVGAMSFRQRGAETVVAERSYTNSSKGEGASEAQRAHRCRLANIVNFYRVINKIEARAWEKKDAYVSDFNMLSKLNLANSPIFLTKEEAMFNASVIAPYTVSRGSLEHLAQSITEGSFDSGIFVPSGINIDTCTVGQFSEALIQTDVNWHNEDKLSVCLMMQTTQTISGVSIPMVEAYYFELTLDVDSTTVMSTLPNWDIVTPAVAENSHLVFNLGCDAAFAIHSRQSAGLLETSEQRVIMASLTEPNYVKYTGAAQKQAAMDSYGYKGEVLLTPFSEGGKAVAQIASFLGVTLNGAAITNNGSTSERGSLVVSGADFNSANCYLTCDGVRWSPMSETASAKTYNLDMAGAFKVYVNGAIVFEWSATVPVIPQTITATSLNGTNYNSTKSGLSITVNDIPADGVPFSVTGTQLGNVTCTSGTVNLTTDSATSKVGKFVPVTSGDSWSITVGDVVALAGIFNVEF